MTTTTMTAETDTPEPTQTLTSSVPPMSVPRTAAAAVPIPVLAPYLGLVASVLSALGGGWLLLAPYALDLRHGAAHLPRTAKVDLETGAAIVAVGILAAALFSLNLAMRLRPEPRPENSAEPEAVTEPETEGPEPSAKAKEPDPGGALRELLTPLVTALAADLRSHDEERASASVSTSTGASGRVTPDESHRRQEP